MASNESNRSLFLNPSKEDQHVYSRFPSSKLFRQKSYLSPVKSQMFPYQSHTHILSCPLCPFLTLTWVELTRHLREGHDTRLLEEKAGEGPHSPEEIDDDDEMKLEEQTIGHEKIQRAGRGPMLTTFTCSLCDCISTEHQIMFEHIYVYHNTDKEKIQLIEKHYRLKSNVQHLSSISRPVSSEFPRVYDDNLRHPIKDERKLSDANESILFNNNNNLDENSTDVRPYLKRKQVDVNEGPVNASPISCMRAMIDETTSSSTTTTTTPSTVSPVFSVDWMTGNSSPTKTGTSEARTSQTATNKETMAIQDTPNMALLPFPPPFPLPFGSLPLLPFVSSSASLYGSSDDLGLMPPFLNRRPPGLDPLSFSSARFAACPTSLLDLRSPFPKLHLSPEETLQEKVKENASWAKYRLNASSGLTQAFDAIMESDEALDMRIKTSPSNSAETPSRPISAFSGGLFPTPSAPTGLLPPRLPFLFPPPPPPALHHLMQMAASIGSSSASPRLPLSPLLPRARLYNGYPMPPPYPLPRQPLPTRPPSMLGTPGLPMRCAAQLDKSPTRIRDHFKWFTSFNHSNVNSNDRISSWTRKSINPNKVASDSVTPITTTKSKELKKHYHNIVPKLESMALRSHRQNFTPLQNRILLEWYHTHRDKPYPSTEDTKLLAIKADLSYPQVKKWFANKRARTSLCRSKSVNSFAKSRLSSSLAGRMSFSCSSMARYHMPLLYNPTSTGLADQPSDRRFGSLNSLERLRNNARQKRLSQERVGSTTKHNMESGQEH